MRCCCHLVHNVVTRGLQLAETNWRAEQIRGPHQGKLWDAIRK